MALQFFIISVNKIKNNPYQTFELEYLKRLNLNEKILLEIKGQESKEQEAALILKKIESLCPKKKFKLILLTEHGKLYHSTAFSEFYQKLEEQNYLTFFVIGGAFGHAPLLIDQASNLLSLSPLTFPHHLSRLILIEQIYRAKTILNHHPYHH